MEVGQRQACTCDTRRHAFCTFEARWLPVVGSAWRFIGGFRHCMIGSQQYTLCIFAIARSVCLCIAKFVFDIDLNLFWLLFTHPLAHPPSHSLTRLSIHSPAFPLTQPPTHTPTYPLTTHSPAYPLTHPPTHPLTRLPTHSPTHPLTHPPTHSLTHP